MNSISPYLTALSLAIILLIGSEDYVKKNMKKLSEQYEPVPSEFDKIRSAFVRKYEEICYRGDGPTRSQDKWRQYLLDNGCEFVGSDTHLASPLDNLMERIYSGIGDKVVVESPGFLKAFIIVPRDMSDKILVLGGLP